MNAKRKSLEQAFPMVEPPSDVANYHSGMTIRDQFALAVINGVYTNTEALAADPKEIIKTAYLVADAAMEVR